MPVFYLDTSGIIKRYRSEAGTDVIDQLLTRPAPTDRFYSSLLSVLELTSGIRRLEASHQLPHELATGILAQFSRTTQELIQLWPLNGDVVTRAVHVASQHLLRSGDAIHLATALLLQSLDPNERTVMVSADRELAAAARAAGLMTLDPAAPDASRMLEELLRPS